MTVGELLPRVRELAGELGEAPSRNRVMREFSVGAPKARDVLALLAAESAESERADSPEPAADPWAHAEPVAEPAPEPAEPAGSAVEPAPEPATAPRVASWPLVLLALPAFVAVWSGWVGLGELTGFGVVHPLPGIWSRASLNTAITLPIGVEAYAAYALRAWLAGPTRARRFARVSAIGSLVLGALGQVAYHVMTAAGVHHAPTYVTVPVACLPVAVLGMGAALTHLLRGE